MFIAGIELFFGLAAGALLLWLGSLAVVSAPHFANKPVRWFADRSSRDWAFMALIAVALVGMFIR